MTGHTAQEYSFTMETRKGEITKRVSLHSVHKTCEKYWQQHRSYYKVLLHKQNGLQKAITVGSTFTDEKTNSKTGCVYVYKRNNTNLQLPDLMYRLLLLHSFFSTFAMV